MIEKHTKKKEIKLLIFKVIIFISTPNKLHLDYLFKKTKLKDGYGNSLHQTYTKQIISTSTTSQAKANNSALINNNIQTKLDYEDSLHQFKLKP